MPADLEAAHSRLHSRHDRVLMAAVANGKSVHRTFGAPSTADAEIGSVSKGITGLLYRDAVERGEVTEDATLGEVLGDTAAPYAKVTLKALATHASGLPALPQYPKPRTVLQRSWRMWRQGENAYGDTVDELLAAAASVRLGKPRFAYSNLGFMLLGAALARAAGTSYEDLVVSRIAKPLGMTGTYVPATLKDLRPGALTGRAKGGRPHEAWTGEALGPAGGVRATSADLAALLTGLLEGRAPGISALDPVAGAMGASRIGAAWVTTGADGADVNWHNGRTGGFGSWVGVDRAARVGFAIISATATSLDQVGFAEIEHLRSAA